MGYDSIICVGAIFLASSVFMLFSVVIASNAAGTTFVDGLYWRIVGSIFNRLFILVRYLKHGLKINGQLLTHLH